MDEGKISNSLTDGPETYTGNMGKRPNFHFCHDPSIRFCYGPQVTWYNTLSPEDDPSTCWTEWTLWTLWGDRSGMQDREQMVITWVFVATTNPARSAATRLLGLRVQFPPVAYPALVSVVCCQVEFSETGRSLVQAGPTECVCVCVFVSLSVIRCNNYPLYPQWAGRRGQDKKESVWLTNKYGCWCTDAAQRLGCLKSQCATANIHVGWTKPCH